MSVLLDDHGMAGTYLQPGDVLGGYRVDALIGVGGMAVVYKATQLSLSRPVALKVLSAQLSADPVFRERFRREGEHAAALEHEHIVPVYDSGEADGRLYIAMRLVRGQTLAERMGGHGLSLDETLAIIGPVADALDVAHESGLVHRDIKPQNILVTNSDHSYLVDFGIAKQASGAGLTTTGSFVGSVNYASPEQIRAETLTPASDVYSLTAVLFQCLTGEVPYPRETDAGVMHAHLNDEPPALSRLSTSAPITFDEVIRRGLAKDPSQRYITAHELLADLGTAAADLARDDRVRRPAFATTPPASAVAAEPVSPAPIGGTVAESRPRAATPPPAEPARRVARDVRVPWAIVAAVVAAVLVPLLLYVSRGSSPSSPATATAAALELTAPPGWSEQSPPRLPYFADTPVAWRGPRGQAVEAGKLKSGPVTGAAPAAFLASLGSEPQSDRVAIGKLTAKVYDGSPKSGGAVRLYVLPTTAGDMGLRCTAATGASLAFCERLATTIRLRHASALTPGADPGTARRVEQTLSGIAAAEKAARPSLAGRSRARRASAAADLSAGSLRGERVVRGLHPAPADSAALANLAVALKRRTAAWARVAAAARRGSRGLDQSGRDSLRRAQGSLRRALQDLDSHGYRVAFR